MTPSQESAADRTMVMHRDIAAPRSKIWATWMNNETLPHWWGPDGFSCQTQRIDLRRGGEWLFDMIGPDGTVYPNHHLYREVTPEETIRYALLFGEDGPKHADAHVSLNEKGGTTQVILAMTFGTVAECRQVKDFGAEAMGQQTLGKLERVVLGG